MDKILVIDNFLSSDEIIKCKEIIVNLLFVHGVTSDGNKKYFSTPFWGIDVNNNEFFRTTVIKIIEKKTCKRFRIHKIVVNAQTYGENGIYHIDNIEDGRYTFVLYFSNINKEELEHSEGCLEIKTPNEIFIASYEPEFNRGILFPSNYLHRGLSLSKHISDIRISIAWKLKEIT